MNKRISDKDRFALDVDHIVKSLAIKLAFSSTIIALLAILAGFTFLSNGDGLWVIILLTSIYAGLIYALFSSAIKELIHKYF